MARGDKVHVSKAYAYESGITEAIIKSAIERWCSEQGVNYADAPKFIKQIEVPPGEYPQTVMGIKVVPDSNTRKNHLHLTVY